MSFVFQNSLLVLPRISKIGENAEEGPEEGFPAVHLGMNGKYLVFRPYGPGKIVKIAPAGYGFKMLGDVPLIKNTFEANGFRESKNNWTVLWGNGYMNTNIYIGISRYQKINHFPRSYEISRKDLLFKNIAKMQSLHGKQHFSFVPETYVLPNDTRMLENSMLEAPDVVWILKPAAKSQGKGIYLTSSPQELPVGQSYVACKYIENPLLINGLKFDLRIYVAVTSVDPLRIYIYKEGLARFATSAYSTSEISNRFAHLTNYSVNKQNPDFYSTAEDGKGHKWTLTALKKYFSEKNLNFSLIWQKIKDIVIKTILSAESKIVAGMKMHVPYRTNCFELLGFDILVDDTLTPWLLEVNLSPSLNTDSEIDLKVKSLLISDLFTLIGIQTKLVSEKKPAQSRPEWNSSTITKQDVEISKEEMGIINETNAELKRLGGFERIFPSEYSYLFSHFFEEQRYLNLIVCGEFEKAKRTPNRRNEKAFMGSIYKQKLTPVARGSRKKPNSAIYMRIGEDFLNKLYK
jgi:tubulin polyglutamylase TTLL5